MTGFIVAVSDRDNMQYPQEQCCRRRYRRIYLYNPLEGGRAWFWFFVHMYNKHLRLGPSPTGILLVVELTQRKKTFCVQIEHATLFLLRIGGEYMAVISMDEFRQTSVCTDRSRCIYPSS